MRLGGKHTSPLRYTATIEVLLIDRDNNLGHCMVVQGTETTYNQHVLARDQAVKCGCHASKNSSHLWRERDGRGRRGLAG